MIFNKIKLQTSLKYAINTYILDIKCKTVKQKQEKILLKTLILSRLKIQLSNCIYSAYYYQHINKWLLTTHRHKLDTGQPSATYVYNHYNKWTHYSITLLQINYKYYICLHKRILEFTFVFKPIVNKYPFWWFYTYRHKTRTSYN